MQETLKTDVLIVGAGPTGLTLAVDLKRRGINCIVVDKAAAPTDKSKALGVQAGTLEALENTIGPEIVKKMTSNGQPAKQANFHIDHLDPVTIDLSVIDSKYNHILILEQSKTEQFLIEALDAFYEKVQRNTELISLLQTENEVTCTLLKSDGTQYQISSSYVAGCDGAHSAVRHALDLKFTGDSYEGEFILGDVEIRWPYDYESVRVCTSSLGSIAFFPMNRKQHYRMILILKGGLSTKVQTEISFDEFSKIAKKLTPFDLEISNPEWLTEFRVHHRLCQSFGKGRVFIAGDAAHIHSPAGGQGMNTGMQDALNLSHKIYLVLKKKQPLDILPAYEADRIKVAKSVVRGTDRVFSLALLPENALTKFLRAKVIRHIIGFKPLRDYVIRAISEVAVARREIALRNEK